MEAPTHLSVCLSVCSLAHPIVCLIIRSFIRLLVCPFLPSLGASLERSEYPFLANRTLLGFENVSVIIYALKPIFLFNEKKKRKKARIKSGMKS